MTVSSTTTKRSASGDGSNDTFSYNFKIFDDDDITVIIRTDSTGAETTKTKTTHYTVTGVGSASGGNVVFTSGNIPASGETVVLLRTTARTQLTDYVANDPFPAATHEDALDKLTFIVQELEEEIGRAIKVSKTNIIATSEFTTSAADRANKLLSFDGSGDLTVTTGKVDTVTASVSAVSAGGSPTASATYTAASGALALAFGLVTGNTGATGNSAGMQLTFSNSTSDADPGAGKLALNNATIASVTEMYFDDVDDNGATISTFVQTFDDISNATARGIISIEKEGTPSTFALFKVTGAVTNASGYTKVPVGHLASNGSFSNADGIRVDFNYSGADGAGTLTDVVSDTTPQLGGDLDMNGQDIVTTSNATIDLAPNGTGTVVVRGNTNSGRIVLNCESNSHGQTLASQPHSASVTNTMLLPAGADSTLVSLVSSDTLTNKTLSTGCSISSGFGNIDNGSSTITTTGTINGGDVVVGDDITVAGRASGHVTTDNDGSFDLAVGNDFQCTPSGNFTLTFTNAAAGQSGNILLINSGGLTVSAHADVAINATTLTALTTAGTYHLAYYCSAASGSNTIAVSASGALT